MTSYNHFEVSEKGDITIAILTDPKLSDTTLVTEIEREMLGKDAYSDSDIQVPNIVQEVRKALVVDFRNVKRSSTTIMNSLLRAKKDLNKERKELRLCGMIPVVREAYRILNMDGTVFIIHGGEEEAVRELLRTLQADDPQATDKSQ